MLSSKIMHLLYVIYIPQLQRTEDVHIMVAPGTYAVTAGQWGKAQEQTHVVHVNQGSTVELDFVL